MLLLILNHLRNRRGLVLLVSICAAIFAAAFLLFQAASSAATLTADRTLARYWRTTYDLLVRSPESLTEIEITQGLVRPNHLSGAVGGITLDQWEQIKTLPDVEIAAPVAMLGYLPRGAVALGIRDPLPMGIYRVTSELVVQNGAQAITYTLPDPIYEWYDEGQRKTLWVTGGEAFQKFDEHLKKLGLYSHGFSTWRGFMVWMPASGDMALLAAIDPVEEAKLLHLDKMLVQGEYLANGSPEILDGIEPIIPALLNVHDYVDQRIRIRIERVGDPAPKEEWAEWLMGIPNRKALESIPTKVVWEQNLPIQREWVGESLVLEARDGQIKSVPGVTPGIFAPLFSPSPVDYGRHADAPVELSADRLALEAIPLGSIAGAEDEWSGGWTRTPETLFREFKPRQDPWLRFEPVVQGAFEIDPMQALAGFAPNQVPLETYLPPYARLTYDAEGRVLKPPIDLHPTLNDAGYLLTPPDILIPLDKVSFLLEKGCVDGALIPQGSFLAPDLTPVPCQIGDDYISAIRVRVAGIDNLDAFAQAKIERVAQEIVERTGLHVDIMSGSSPQPVLVHLPGFGPVPNQGYIEELWVKKGVNTLFQQGLNLADRLWFISLLLVCLLLLINSSYLLTLGRLGEFGLLRAIGWRIGTIFRLLLGEFTILGLLSGSLGLIIVLASRRLLALSISPSHAILLIPLGAAAFLAGGLLPVWRASRADPALLLNACEIFHPRRLAGGHSLFGYALNGLLRRPARTLSGLLSLALSAGMLVLLALSLTVLEGELYGTLLGAWIRTVIQPYHFFLAGLALGMAALGVATLMILNVHQRRTEIGLLSALGWRSASIFRLFVVEGLLLGLAGGFLGGTAAFCIFRLAYGAFPSDTLGWLFSTAVAVVLLPAVTVVACLIPAGRAARLLPLSALHGQERLVEFRPQKTSILWAILASAAIALVAFLAGQLPILQSSQPPPAADLNLPAQPTPTLPVLAHWDPPDTIKPDELPHYQLDLVFDPDAKMLSGHEEIVFTNRTGDSLETIGVRLYPNLPRNPGGQPPLNLQIEAASVDVHSAAIEYTSGGHLALLRPFRPVPPGQEVQISLNFSLDLATYGSLSSQGWLLNSCFPWLAIYDENGGWRHDECSYCTDVVSNESGLVFIEVQMPDDWALISPAVSFQSMPEDASVGAYTSHEFSFGPVRDPVLVFLPGFQMQSTKVGETEIRLYSQAAEKAPPTKILEVTAAALQFYSERFGPYPYPALSLLASMQGAYSGTEYSGFISLAYSSDESDKSNETMTALLAHEVAHQWWYAVVGNDIYREPWLDEALAEYSSMLFLEASGDESQAQRQLDAYQVEAQKLELGHTECVLVGSPVDICPDFSTYVAAVYRKGSVFLHTLRQTIGDTAFFAGLQEYYQWYRFGVGDSRGFLEAMQSTTEIDILPLFIEWVGIPQDLGSPELMQKSVRLNVSAVTPTPTMPTVQAWALPTPVALPKNNQISLFFYSENETINGSGRLEFTNRSDEPVATLSLHLFANKRPHGEEMIRRMRIRNGQIEVLLPHLNLQTLPITYSQDGESALASLDPPLQPGEKADVFFYFDLQVEDYKTGDGNYLIPFPFPVLAVFEGGRWRTDTCSFCSTPLMNQVPSSSFELDLAVPRSWDVVASGQLKDTYRSSFHRELHYVYEIEPARDLLLAFGPNLKERESNSAGVQMNVFYQPDQAMVAEQALSIATQAYEFYTSKFGIYPYPSLSLLISPAEYPDAVSFTNLAVVSTADEGDFARRVALAIARQWWSQAVAADPFREPWLDAALPNYASYLFLQSHSYPIGMSQVLANVQPVEQLARPLWDFKDEATYRNELVEPSVAFIHQIHQEVGDDAFFAGLRRYFEWYRHGIGRSQGLLQALQQGAGEDISPIFDNWIGLENLR